MNREVPPEINVPNTPAILWVGRDPGANEVAQRRPFVGQAGDMLMAGINQAGTRRVDCNFANLVPTKPWNNDFKRHRDEDIQMGRQGLTRLIRKLSPSLVVALGNEAGYALIPEYNEITGSRSIRRAKGVTNTRGFFFWNADLQVWVLSSLHPSSVLYQGSQQFQFFVDTRRAVLFHGGDLPRQKMPTPRIIRAPKDLDRFRTSTLTAFDIETEWGGNKLLCTAFCGDDLIPSYGWGSDLPAMREYLTTSYPKVAHNGKFDRHYLTYKCNTPIGGLNDDTMSLHWAMFPELAGQEDTGGEEKLDKKKKKKNRITRKGLLFLASVYLNVPWWKSYDHSNPHLMAMLCSQDVWVTRMLYDRMYPEAEKLDVINQYRENMDLQSSYIECLHRGMLIDKELLTSRMKALRKRAKKNELAVNKVALRYIRKHKLPFFLQTRRCKCCNGVAEHCWGCAGLPTSPKRKADYIPWLGEATVASTKASDLKAMLPTCSTCNGVGQDTWYDFNFGSATQMKELIFNQLGAPESLVVGTSYASEDTLRKVQEEWATLPTNRTVLGQRRAECTKILDPYFQGKRDKTMITVHKRVSPGRDGRIRTELSSYRVVTGRAASGESFVEKSTNLQNLPKATAYEDSLYAIRECIVPDPGMVFLLADYEKAEAVVAACMSADWDFYDRMMRGDDIHSWHAAMYFDRPEWLTTKADAPERHIGKTVTYASAYMASVNKVMQTINSDYYKTGVKLTKLQVEAILRTHLNLHPLEEWWEETRAELHQQNNWLENPFGLRRQFTNPNFYDRWKQAVNWKCQSTVASAINKSWRWIWHNMDYDGLAYLNLQVHDEIILQVRRDLAEEVGSIVKTQMEQPFFVRGREVHIPVEVCIAEDNWHNKRVIHV